MAQINIGRILPIFKSQWREEVPYTKLDVVYYLGSSYVAMRDNVGKAPNENYEDWQIVASKGSNGGVNYEVGNNNYNDF